MSDGFTLASNSDRDRVVARLADAHIEGRLTVEEPDRLTGEAHAARTLGHLDLVCANIPGGEVAVPRRLIGLVTALALLRGETNRERRRLLTTWAYVCAAVLAVEIAILVFVVL